MTKKQTLIIEAALTVLIRDGGVQFSARKVASEAGMSLGNLQYHYKTKFDLLKGVIDSQLAFFLESLDEFLERNLTGLEGLIELVQLSGAVDNSSGVDQLFLAISLQKSEPGLDSELAQFYRSISRQLKQCLRVITQEQCSNETLTQATQLFIVYLEGYDVVKAYGVIEREAATKQLTLLLSKILF